MEIPTESSSGIEKNKGKFVVLIFYILFVLISPLYYLLPFAKNDSDFIINSLVSDDADKFFREYFELLKKGDLNKVHSLMTTEVQEQFTPEQFKNTSTPFASTTGQIRVVGGKYNSYTGSGKTTKDYDIFYELQNDDPLNKYLIAEIVAEDKGAGLKISGVFLTWNTVPAEEHLKFDIKSQGLFLALSVLIPLFIAYTAFRYLTKAKNPGWIIFLVILFLTLYLNFQGGSYGVNFGFYGFMNKAGSLSPWVFLVPIPAGAIYYYFVRKKHENLEA